MEANGFVETIRDLENTIEKLTSESKKLKEKISQNTIYIEKSINLGLLNNDNIKLSKSFFVHDSCIVVDRKIISHEQEEISIKINISGYGETQKIKNHLIPHIIYDNFKHVQIEQKYLMGHKNSL